VGWKRSKQEPPAPEAQPERDSEIGSSGRALPRGSSTAPALNPKVWLSQKIKRRQTILGEPFRRQF
jgi:hypothetical protein